MGIAGLTRTCATATAAAWALAAPYAAAQILPPGAAPIESRPTDRLPAPDLQRPQPQPEFRLPDFVPPSAPGRLSSALRIQVARFRITGNTVFTEDELRAPLARFEGREIGNEELEEARRIVTAHYVTRGYINSGAVLPDQDVAGGIITLQVIEGRLSDVAITGENRFVPEYIRDRVVTDPEKPLNVQQLQERLQILLQNPLIDRINAELGPGERLGEAVLRLNVKEAPPYEVGYTFANNRSPAIGGYLNEFRGSARNLFGRGVSLGLRAGFTEGLEEYTAALNAPIAADDTAIALRADKNRSVVIEEPFSKIDIVSRSSTLEVGLTRPVYRTLQQEFALGAYFYDRENETFLLGQPFSFTPGLADGRSRVKALRLTADWFDRSETQVIAARLSYRQGLDLPGATVNPGYPDAIFNAAFIQLQWIRRLSEAGNHFVARFDTQTANGPLLPSEKYALGGAENVRGYRENRLVKDRGWFGSLEYRHPVGRWVPEAISDRSEDGKIHLAVFADAGRGTDAGEVTIGVNRLSSVGLGLRWDITEGAHLRLYYGKALKKAPVLESDPQDRGIHFLFAISKAF